MNRFDKFIAIAVFVLAGALAGCTEAPAEDTAPPDSDRPPNVVILFSDDHGTIDLNVYGSTDLYTPRLDRLADEGVRFNQFYAGAPVCSPSRGVLLSGRYPIRNGVVGNSNPFNDGEVILPDMLSEIGYITGHFGKWHLGTGGHETDQPELHGPNAEGFDHSFGFLGGCIDKWSHFNYGGGAWGDPPKWHDLQRNGEEVWASGRHSGDLIADEAINFIEGNRDRPFFMYVAFGTPHYPLQPYDKYMDHYKDLEEPRRTYAALVSTLDEQTGRIVDRLDELGLRENTLVIFQSDQGHSVEERANNGGGNAGRFRGAKFSMFEGGIRVPAIASMPGMLPEGEVRDLLAHGADWYPTIAELTGAPLPDRTIDGKSLLSVLRSGDSESPHDVVQWQAFNERKRSWAVREGPWKLIFNPRDDTETGPVEVDYFLSNLDEDVGERLNFADDHPDVVARLKQHHDELVRDVRREAASRAAAAPGERREGR